MKVRFRETTPSAHPEYPFRAGQIIEVPRLSPELRQWIRAGRAELVPDKPEAAAVTTDDAERATLPPATKRRHTADARA